MTAKTRWQELLFSDVSGAPAGEETSASRPIALLRAGIPLNGSPEKTQTLHPQRKSVQSGDVEGVLLGTGEEGEVTHAKSPFIKTGRQIRAPSQPDELKQGAVCIPSRVTTKFLVRHLCRTFWETGR